MNNPAESFVAAVLVLMLALKENELEKKFANTNAFKTMNYILKQKNSKIKELRDVIKQNGINAPESDEKEEDG
ncbi:hypothetical protein Tcan_08489 [Toxocara canis]|uniref:Uncharacterized protein n=1 Tax=Toxocara canis TaxID=6265 RepID=A0A0B2VQZ3_TOXCA|nr:hypothetical protein Tcan_08489 [Toxocara canis]